MVTGMDPRRVCETTRPIREEALGRDEGRTTE